MRQAEREITDPGSLERILHEAKVLFLALRDFPAPYVLPVCFGHDPANPPGTAARGTLYVHCAPTGAKIDLLRADPAVGFSACTDMTVRPGAAACDFSCRSESVVGTGRARVVETEEERIRGLDAIMRHYAEGPAAAAPAYRPGSLSRTSVIAVDIDSLRGKRIG
jgi:hypothetical protein